MSVRPLTQLSRNPAGRRLISTTFITKQDQTFQLPDGRILGFAEYGSPDGKPLLFFHGYPSSRLEASPVETIALRRGIRIISLDRPGYGLSTPQPNRTLVDYPADVEAFAKGMNLDKFAVIGGSGGGPYALACAHILPRQMLTGVGLFASAPPWIAGRHHMSFSRRVLSVLVFRWPGLLRVIFKAFVSVMERLVATDFGKKRIDALIDALEAKAHESKGEKEAESSFKIDAAAENADTLESKDERRENLLKLLLREPMRQGVECVIEEARLLSAQDWGFQFGDVKYNPVWIWHGANDANAPIAMIRYMAERLPHCNLVEYKDDTHYTMFARLEQALDQLMPETKELKEAKKESA